MKAHIFAFAALFLAALSGIVFALSAQNDTFGNIAIYRIYPETAYIGQKIWISLAIENRGGSEAAISVSEKLGDAGFNRTGTTVVPAANGDIYFYDWDIAIPAGGNTSVSYWITPHTAGTYVITPAALNISGKQYRLKSVAIRVTCLAENSCNTSAGENFLNCPQNCKSGSADGVCDGVPDGICDPDCTAASDIDCKAQVPATQAPNITISGSKGNSSGQVANGGSAPCAAAFVLLAALPASAMLAGKKGHK
jgi:hypothetical protein